MRYILNITADGKNQHRAIGHIERVGATLLKNLNEHEDYSKRSESFIIDADANAIHILKGKGYHPNKIVFE